MMVPLVTCGPIDELVEREAGKDTPPSLKVQQLPKSMAVSTAISSDTAISRCKCTMI